MDSKACTGAQKIKDLLPLDTYKRFTDKNLEEDFDPESDLNPCGTMAKFLFTDSFQLFEGEMQEDGSKVVDVAKQIVINETNIAHRVDREVKFKKAKDSKQWIDVTNGKCPVDGVSYSIIL